jgi:hypothetical protein
MEDFFIRAKTTTLPCSKVSIILLLIVAEMKTGVLMDLAGFVEGNLKICNIF